MITWITKRRWVRRAMKGFDKDSEEYKFLDRLQFTMKVINNMQYGMIKLNEHCRSR